jgi:hypothetical protein
MLRCRPLVIEGQQDHALSRIQLKIGRANSAGGTANVSAGVQWLLSLETTKRIGEKLSKVVDNSYTVRCAVGIGEFREEVWMNASGKEVRYNLAFINPSPILT